ncbi:MAG: SUMF1/EgtB/PvdO family nonheme iron enzyme [Anaerolineae bacterium]|nr:SUMF1/EgtB/PvdO family nonheme iron enzyme [Anaerolineae bacterium]
MKLLFALVLTGIALLILTTPSATSALPGGAPNLSATGTPKPTPVPVVTANAEWTPVYREFDGVEMALAPPGCFMMGSEAGDEDEQPVSEICIDAPFWLDVTEATNAQFEPFQGKFQYPGNWFGPNQPRDYLKWIEADRFCTLRGARLPTEAEWEYAARGPDGLIYPWGDEFMADSVVFRANSGDVPADVGSRPDGASWVGALDMLGNVAEWTASEFRPYPYDAGDGRESPNDGGNEERVFRGGAFNQPAEMLSTTSRGASEAREDAWTPFIGVRCARSYGE